jgi:hypothetical protein
MNAAFTARVSFILYFVCNKVIFHGCKYRRRQAEDLWKVGAHYQPTQQIQKKITKKNSRRQAED